MPRRHRSPANCIEHTGPPRTVTPPPETKQPARTLAGCCMKRVGLPGLDQGFGLDFVLGLSWGRRRDGLEVDLELDIVTEQEAAGLESLVPGQVVVLSVQLGLGGEAHAAVAPWVLALATEAGVKRDLLAFAADGHITDHLEVRRGLTLDSLALEGDGRIFLDIKVPIGAAEVVIAHLNPSIDGRRIEDNVDFGGIQVVVVDLDVALFDLHLAAHFRHHVPDRKRDAAMARIDCPLHLTRSSRSPKNLLRVQQSPQQTVWWENLFRMAADLKPAEMRAWAAFLDAQAALLRQLESELIEKEDMTLAEFDVLIQLGMAPDRRLRMTELSERVRLSRSGLTRLVDRLVQAGLVKRGQCAEDRRGTFAILTTVGGSRLHHARPVHLRGVREHFGKRLSAAQLSALAEALEPLGRPMRSTAPGVD